MGEGPSEEVINKATAPSKTSGKGRGKQTNLKNSLRSQLYSQGSKVRHFLMVNLIQILTFLWL